MQPVSLFLLLLLPPADATGDLSAAIQGSLRRELGDVAVAVAPDTLVTPAMWQGPKAPMRSRFLARVTWTAADKASVELRAVASARPVEDQTRELSFARQDSKGERGRAIGLVLAELLRESPVSTFTDGPTVARGTVLPTPPRLAFGAMLATERAMSGHWAKGPALTYAFPFHEALQLEARGMALFASDQYSEIGFAVGLRWSFLRMRDGRHALGIGLSGDVFRESATGGSEDQRTAARWNAAAAASLAARISVWRGLRLVGEAGLRAVAAGLVLDAGEEDDVRRVATFSHWRPAFSLGVEIAM